MRAKGCLFWSPLGQFADKSLVGFCSLILPEEMATSLLGVTTFWPLSLGSTLEVLAFGRFIGSFPLWVSLPSALYSYSLVFCESVGEVP